MLERPFDPETRIVSRGAAAPVLERGCDICVVGSGASGVSAAIEAARAGRSVILVDGLPTLGGQAVNSIIGMFCGLFTPGPNGRQLTHGIADEIIHDLKATGDLELVMGGVMWNGMYNEVALGRWVEKSILKAGVTPLTGAIIRKVNMDGRRVTSLDIATRFGDVRVTATAFIDASGDAALAWEAGLDCRMHKNGQVYGSQMLVIEDFDDSKKPPRAEMAERIWDKGLDYGLTRRDGFAATYPGRNAAMVNITHIETPLDRGRPPPDGGRGAQPDQVRRRGGALFLAAGAASQRGRLCVGGLPRRPHPLCAAGLADGGGRGQPVRRGPLHRRGFHGSIQRAGNGPLHRHGGCRRARPRPRRLR